MGLLNWLALLFGSQSNVQIGKNNRNVQTGDNSRVQQTSVGDVSGTVNISQDTRSDGKQ